MEAMADTIMVAAITAVPIMVIAATDRHGRRARRKGSEVTGLAAAGGRGLPSVAQS